MLCICSIWFWYNTFIASIYFFRIADILGILKEIKIKSACGISLFGATIIRKHNKKAKDGNVNVNYNYTYNIEIASATTSILRVTPHNTLNWSDDACIALMGRLGKEFSTEFGKLFLFLHITSAIYSCIQCIWMQEWVNTITVAELLLTTISSVGLAIQRCMYVV